jgi:hypothetical protein
MDAILKILLEWSLKNKEYYMSYIIFTEFNIGIPTSFLYSISLEKKSFNSINDFLNTSDNIYTNNIHLINILTSLKKSKYIRLLEWDNKWGYRYMNIF